MKIAVWLFRAFNAVFAWGWALSGRFGAFMAEVEVRARQAARK